MDTKIIEHLEAFFSQEIDPAVCDLGVLEACVKQKLDLLGKGLLQRLVERSNNGYRASRIRCDCGGTLRFVGRRVKNINTIFGWIKISRAYYHCSDCGQTDVPYDRCSGLGSEQISPGLAQACCLLATTDGFARTGVKIKQLLGPNVSAGVIERVVERVGQVAASQRDDLPHQIQQDNGQSPLECLYVVADGTTVHEKDGWTRKLLKDLTRQCKRYRGKKREVLGYDIGSGAAEGACKHVVAARLKRSGMIWTRPCSSAVLALQVCWLNERWK
jgi:hypothetical protein